MGDVSISFTSLITGRKKGKNNFENVHGKRKTTVIRDVDTLKNENNNNKRCLSAAIKCNPLSGGKCLMVRNLKMVMQLCTVLNFA